MSSMLMADKPVVPKKHRKVSSNTSSTLSVAPNIQNGDKLMSTFKSACSVWTMLHSDSSYAKGNLFNNVFLYILHKKLNNVLVACTLLISLKSLSIDLHKSTNFLMVGGVG